MQSPAPLGGCSRPAPHRAVRSFYSETKLLCHGAGEQAGVFQSVFSEGYRALHCHPPKIGASGQCVKSRAETAARDAPAPASRQGHPLGRFSLPQGNRKKSIKAPKTASNPQVLRQKMHPPCPQRATAPPSACRCSRRKNWAFSKTEGCYSGACSQKVPPTPAAERPPSHLPTLMFPSTTLIFWLLIAWESWKGYCLPFKARAKMGDVALEDEIPPRCEGCAKLRALTSKEISVRNTT